MSSVFNTEDLSVLHTLLQLLLSRIIGSGEHRLTLFGSTNFELVWEDICRLLLDADEDQGDTFGRPVWLALDDLGPNNVESHGRYNPDIVLEQDDEVYIFDAKYYYPYPNSVCDVGDVAKQYMYEEVSKKSVGGNAFLFPTSEGDLLQLLGFASIADNEDLEPAKFKSRRIISMGVNFWLAAERYNMRSRDDEVGRLACALF